MLPVSYCFLSHRQNILPPFQLDFLMLLCAPPFNAGRPETHHLLGQGLLGKTVIKASHSGVRSIFIRCTVRIPEIPWWLAKERGTFRAEPYGEHMWAQENKLLRDRTPSAVALWFSLLIRSARYIHHMWTSSRRGGEKHY